MQKGWMRPIFAGAACVLLASCKSSFGAAPDAAAIANITAAAPAKAAARPLKARQLLVYTRSTGFRHSSIETGAEAMKILGQKTGAWTATVSDDPAVFDNLAPYDGIVFVNTTDDPLRAANWDQGDDAAKATARALEDKRKAALLAFVNGGKGFAGIHAASDAFYKPDQLWEDYVKMIGGSFNGHPWGAGDEVTVRNEDPTHVIGKAAGSDEMTFKEEIYQFKNYSRRNQRVLLGLDMNKTTHKNNQNRDDNDYAVAWIKPQGAGRVFYCSLGHNEAMYANPKVLSFYLSGIQYALGDLKADASSIAQLPNDVGDAVMGEYSTANGGVPVLSKIPTIGGFFSPPPVMVRIIPEGGGNYRAVYNPNSFLPRINPRMNNRPGDLVRDGSQAPDKRIEMTGALKDGAIDFSGKEGDAEYRARWTAQGLTLTAPGAAQAVTLRKLNRTSPTLGQKASRGAINLLPIEADGGPNLGEWTSDQWVRMRDGSMQVLGGDTKTKREFGDAKIHVEWKTPLKPEARGQERGNSGVYLQDRYELQVLDSFGLDSRDNDAGGIYQISKPKVNAGLPPGQWQTYDITYRAPRLYTDGRAAKPAFITVYHNGVLIQDNVMLPHSTGGAASADPAAKAPLRLQAHGNPVRYRNIWVQELNDQPWTPIVNPNPVAAPAAVAPAQPAVAGTKVLFDGANLNNWGTKPDSTVKVEDGAIHITKGSGDVWSKDQYGDFVLDLEYKVSPGANSGVFIRNPTPGDWYAGQEIQVLDSFGHNIPDVHDAGANYDVMAPSKNMARKAGEWNQMRITAKGQNVQVELNGERVLDQNLDLWTQAGKNPDGSGNKFKAAYKDMPKVGHIELQEHDGAEVWYRNIKIRELK